MCAGSKVGRTLVVDPTFERTSVRAFLFFFFSCPLTGHKIQKKRNWPVIGGQVEKKNKKWNAACCLATGSGIHSQCDHKEMVVLITNQFLLCHNCECKCLTFPLYFPVPQTWATLTTTWQTMSGSGDREN